ncbi:hypothetical protein FGIG_03917 [Fasciola gigantica]|uniref:Uncharacterized protein n=1 Tax=Fasciola gigantica TaxID=46835 RepID=A0A504YQ24_FASGI|nr:hypothetical protein FGIG_03917 [Fasciola gigantica]
MSSEYEVRNLICNLANAPKGSRVNIVDVNGTYIPCSGSMPSNGPTSAFMVTIGPADEVNELSLMGRLLESLTKQINDSLKLTDVKAEFNERFKSLESRILSESSITMHICTEWLI